MRSTGAAGALLVFALALAGCGGGDDSSPPAGDPVVVGSDGESSAAEPSASDQATGSDEASGPADGSTETTRTPADADLREASFAVDVAQALQISAEETGAGEVVHTIELDHSRHYDAWVWTIETLIDGTDHEVEIDADTAEVLDHEQDSTDDREQAVDPADPMSPEQAMELATGEVDGPVRGWQLDWDDGAVRYEVEVLRGDDDVDVTVDAASGAVTVDD